MTAEAELKIMQNKLEIWSTA